MRINVYSQELTSETELVSKTGVNAAGVAETFYGVRLYLRSAAELHHTAADDDRSAVTFWLPASQHRRNDLFNAFQELSWLVAHADDYGQRERDAQAANKALGSLRRKLAGEPDPAATHAAQQEAIARGAFDTRDVTWLVPPGPSESVT